jgi:hypothetical protein
MVHDHWGLPEECGPCFFNPNHDKRGRFATKKGGGEGGGRKKKKKRGRKGASGAQVIGTAARAGLFVGLLAGTGVAATALASHAGTARTLQNLKISDAIRAGKFSAGAGAFKKFSAVKSIGRSQLSGASRIVASGALSGVIHGAAIGVGVAGGRAAYRGGKRGYKKYKKRKSGKSRRVKFG